MKHARPDYDRIQDPALDDPTLLSPGSSPIGADEPVMLFRAKDKHFLTVLSNYAQLIARDSFMPAAQVHAMTTAIYEHISRAQNWQLKNGCKSPDIPEVSP